MFEIIYHRLVLKEDLEGLNIQDRKKIIKAVEKKLSVDPVNFGKSLGAELKGYFRLRVDFYRVIYRVEAQKVVVFVVKVGLRRNLKVYLAAAKRLKIL